MATMFCISLRTILVIACMSTAACQRNRVSANSMPGSQRKLWRPELPVKTMVKIHYDHMSQESALVSIRQTTAAKICCDHVSQQSAAVTGR